MDPEDFEFVCVNRIYARWLLSTTKKLKKGLNKNYLLKCIELKSFFERTDVSGNNIQGINAKSSADYQQSFLITWQQFFEMPLQRDEPRVSIRMLSISFRSVSG